jgi:AraC-like DNA-binding protein
LARYARSDGGAGPFSKLRHDSSYALSNTLLKIFRKILTTVVVSARDSSGAKIRVVRDDAHMTAETIAERIKQLLGQGLSTSVVASAVGCDPSYVSQLLEDTEFHSEVLGLRAGKAEENVKRDGSWNEIEDLALQQAKKVLPFVTKPGDLVRIAAMANSAKRRATEFANGSESAAPTVNLVLPESAVIHFQMNQNSQVIEVDGRSMQALPSKHLVQQMAERRKDRELAGVQTVELVGVSRVQETERKKVVSILDQIGYADEPVPVQKVVG